MNRRKEGRRGKKRSRQGRKRVYTVLVSKMCARGTTSALTTAVGMMDFGSCMVKLCSCWGIHVTDMAAVRAMRTTRAGLVEVGLPGVG
jgi:hypothetical protein